MADRGDEPLGAAAPAQDDDDSSTNTLTGRPPARGMGDVKVDVLLGGWGVKLGSRVKSWKRRYFVLRTATAEEAATFKCTHTLLYFKSEAHARAGDAPTGAVPILSGGTKVTPTMKKKKRVLCVQTPGFRDFFVTPVSVTGSDGEPWAEWEFRLTKMEVPANAADLRRSTIGARPVASVTLDQATDNVDDDTGNTDALLGDGFVDPYFETHDPPTPRPPADADSAVRETYICDKVARCIDKIKEETPTLEDHWTHVAEKGALPPDLIPVVAAETLDAIAALHCTVTRLEDQLREKDAAINLGVSAAALKKMPAATRAALEKARKSQAQPKLQPLRDAIAPQKRLLKKAKAFAKTVSDAVDEVAGELPRAAADVKKLCRTLPLSMSDPSLDSEAAAPSKLSVQRVLGILVLREDDALAAAALAVYDLRRTQVTSMLTKVILTDVASYEAAFAARLADPREQEARAALLTLKLSEQQYRDQGLLGTKATTALVEASCADSGAPDKGSVLRAVFERYKGAAMSLALYDKVCAIVHEACDGIDGHPPFVVPGGVKKLPRMVFKTITKYSCDFSKIRDVVRCTVVTPSLRGVLEVASAIVRSTEITVIRVKNRFALGYDARPIGGYVDFQMLVGLQDADGAWSFAEVQVNLEEMVAIKARPNGGHAIFKFARSLTVYDENTYVYSGAISKVACDQVANGAVLTIDMNGNTMYGSGLQKLRAALMDPGCRVTTLDLSGCSLQAKGGLDVARVLKSNRTITTAELKGNTFGPKAARGIAAALLENGTLTVINLQANDIQTEGGLAMAQMLAVNATLISVNLGWNDIGPPADEAIAEAIKVNTVLQSLDLGKNAISPEGGMDIAEALEVNKTLTFLSLWQNCLDPGAETEVLTAWGDRGGKCVTKGVTRKFGATTSHSPF